MALTDEQKSTLEGLKEKIEEWRSEQQDLINKEFNFLNSLQLVDSSLSHLILNDSEEDSPSLVDQVIEDIQSLQLTGEAYSDG